MRRSLCLLLLALPISCWAQWDEDQWSEPASELLDTLTLNNIPPRLLWSLYGLSREAVYELVTYREAMGYIEHPLELLALPEWDSTTVYGLLAQLPLERPEVPNTSRWTSLHRLDLGKRQRLQHTVAFDQRIALGSLHQRTEWEVNSQLTSSVAGFLATRLEGPLQATFVFGDHRHTAGQGLLLGETGFSNPSTAEAFGSGLRGRTGAGALSSPRGLGLQFHHGPWVAEHTLVSTSGVGSSAISYRSLHAMGGWARTGEAQSVFARWHRGPVRAFGEWTFSKTGCAGVNWWAGDVLVEGWVAYDGTRWDPRLYLTWRDELGSWNIRWRQGRVRLNWQGKDWSYSLNQHEQAESAMGSWRHRIRHQHGPWQWDGHFHAGTRGLTSRWTGAVGTWQAAVQLTLVDAHEEPVWAAVPVVSGSIAALAVYEDWSGWHTTWKRGPWQFGGSWNFEKPAAESWQLQVRYLRHWS